ncbi:hypothetical protein DL96DRAFT_1713657 [Flagelloscypha sp. PMI_526]|nr:hypothetical protein DL96DRAFT_1713657 [Flagelloscypha sp. PMI_526]
MSLGTRGYSHLGLSDLSADIIDIIFSYLPDFETLRSAIFISKLFSGVFNKHPKSIVRRVAQNVSGPPLNDLLTLVRFEKDQFEWGSESEDEGEGEDEDEEDAHLDAWVSYFEELPEWQDATEDGHEVKAHETYGIRAYAKSAHLLEEWFSFRHKARVANRSSLTPLESHRFLRAVYRLMLFQKCFPYQDVYANWRVSEPPEVEDKPQAIQRLFAARREFLSTFEWEELHEIQIVAQFILEMRYKLELLEPPNEDVDPENEDPLQVNLELFIDGVHSGNFLPCFDMPPELSTKYLTGPLEEALKKQGSKLLDPSQDHFWMNLLDSAEG